jgi:hypothetical protein
MLPSLRHALAVLATKDALVVPAAATVCVQAAQLVTPRTAGLDLSALDALR